MHLPTVKGPGAIAPKMILVSFYQRKPWHKTVASVVSTTSEVGRGWNSHQIWIIENELANSYWSNLVEFHPLHYSIPTGSLHIMVPGTMVLCRQCPRDSEVLHLIKNKSLPFNDCSVALVLTVIVNVIRIVRSVDIAGVSLAENLIILFWRPTPLQKSHNLTIKYNPCPVSYYTC